MSTQLHAAADAGRRALSRQQARRRMETTMFGIIARFERAFGSLWAHGRPEASLTPEEVVWRQLWTAVRKDCLDHAHREARMLDTELGG